jgi:hypothetical protein
MAISTGIFHGFRENAKNGDIMEGHEKKYNNIFINHRDIMGIGTYL